MNSARCSYESGSPPRFATNSVTNRHPELGGNKQPENLMNGYGCFQKSWYPRIIHFYRVFHCKPSILGYPYFWKHPYSTNELVFSDISERTWFLVLLFSELSALFRAKTLMNHLIALEIWRFDYSHSNASHPEQGTEILQF